MALLQRTQLFGELEDLRKRPLLVYVTSSRQGSSGMMAKDAVPEFLTQLNTLPPDADSLDLLLVSDGGDPTVAWRVVSLIRERVKSFAVLVPQAAYSAATLVALGADEIVMHAHGNLGPVDPQITITKKPKDAPPQQLTFGSEDLAAFLKFARETVGLSDQKELAQVFELFCKEVGPVPIGTASRSSQLAVSMSEKLLMMHMGDAQQARAIAETLNKKFFHHGYPLGRKEAKDIGLNVTAPSSEVEALLWRIWTDVEEELRSRQPFTPLELLRNEPACAPLFAPAPLVVMPANLPPQLQQQAYQQVLQQVQVTAIPAVEYVLIHAVMESRRCASRFVTEGRILSTRLPDLTIRYNLTQERQGWRTITP